MVHKNSSVQDTTIFYLKHAYYTKKGSTESLITIVRGEFFESRDNYFFSMCLLSSTFWKNTYFTSKENFKTFDKFYTRWNITLYY